MIQSSIDLHMHSRYSIDGDYEPSLLVKKCKEQGIHIMSVADHNSVRANKEAREAAERANINYINGIEIDTIYQDINLHVLGYGIDDNSDDFYDIEENVRKQNQLASCEMLSLTQKMGFSVTKEEMDALNSADSADGIYTGEMFAEVLLQKEIYKQHPLLMPYREGGARGDNPYVNFYWDFYSQGKPCFVKINYPRLKEVCDIIHDNGGKAVLAHPGVNLKGKETLLEGMIKDGLDGIEVFSSYHTREQSGYYEKQAEAHCLFMTCGSDFHGKTKPSISLGGCGNGINDHKIEQYLMNNGLIR